MAERRGRTELAFIFLLLALLALRGAGLEGAPAQLYVDEPAQLDVFSSAARSGGPIQAFSFYIGPYGSIVQGLSDYAFSRALGPVFALRLASYLHFALAVLLLYLVAARLTGSKTLGALSSLFLFFLPYSRYVFALGSLPEGTTLAYDLLFIFLILKWRDHRRAPLLALAFFALGVSTGAKLSALFMAVPMLVAIMGFDRRFLSAAAIAPFALGFFAHPLALALSSVSGLPSGTFSGVAAGLTQGLPDKFLARIYQLANLHDAQTSPTALGSTIPFLFAAICAAALLLSSPRT